MTTFVHNIKIKFDDGKSVGTSISLHEIGAMSISEWIDYFVEQVKRKYPGKTIEVIEDWPI